MEAFPMAVHGLPFSFLLQELRARDAGLREPWAPGQREQVLGDLVVAEAEEIAHGLRHLSVVHGELVDPVEAELIGELIGEVCEMLSRAEGQGLVQDVRLSGSDVHLTITMGGSEVDRWVRQVTETVRCCQRPGWQLIETARV
jgi:hypothetical protein